MQTQILLDQLKCDRRPWCADCRPSELGNYCKLQFTESAGEGVTRDKRYRDSSSPRPVPHYRIAPPEKSPPADNLPAKIHSARPGETFLVWAI